MKSCQFQHLISAYYDKEVAPEEKQRIEEHLSECAACQEFFNELVFFRTSLQEMPDREYDVSLTRRILNRLEQMQNSLYAWQTFEVYIQRALLAFVIVIALFFAILLYNEPQNEYVQQQFSIISDSSASIFLVPSDEITKQDIAYVALTSH